MTTANTPAARVPNSTAGNTFIDISLNDHTAV